ncbi:hypothetical protein AB0L75_05505 [Streptomyces sp. NPDC052101]|uniref:hypothetical protein n=1 Tax=Streptomyces sp. NPDC052101 TaxID=3155763 RepID=UPI00341B85FF
MSSRRLRAAGVAAALLAALTACGGDKGDDARGKPSATAPSGSPSPTQNPVHGLKDTLRHVTRRTTLATRPHLVRRCTTGTRQVRHTTSSGSGSHRRTRTSYTTEHYQSCRKVPNGTETYRRELRPERWCVRLDDVNGNRKQDDTWFRVDRLDYDHVLDADDHTRVQFVPLSPDTGC